MIAVCDARRSDQSSIDALVEQHLSLVGYFVRERMAQVPSHVNRDDLTSAGMEALVLSARSFDAGRGVSFAGYASIRIRGALIDELRSMDWASRSVRTRAREVDAVRSHLAVDLHRAPSANEVATVMGISIGELNALECDLVRADTVSLDGFAPEVGPSLVREPSADPEALIVFREQLGYLHDAIAALPERLRFVVTAYFFQDRQMRDIGAELGVSESRVSQLRTEALRLLRDGMNAQTEPSTVVEPESGSANQSARARQSYYEAIASGTVSSRLAMTTARGQMRRAGTGAVRVPAA
jgi:RNA polymerase sigma factor for flagellar operon FliA